MKTLITSITLLFSLNIFAVDLFCSIKEAKKANIEYENFMFLTDKHKHCAYSCFMAHKCGLIQSFSTGVLKEIVDMFTPGDSDINDIKANNLGIKFSKEIEFQDDCFYICEDYYLNS